MKSILAVVLLTIVFASSVEAHGGRRDKHGGHNNSKEGNYHFHTGPLAGRTYDSQAEALKALRRAESGETHGEPQPASTTQSDLSVTLHPTLGVGIAPEVRHTPYSSQDYPYPASVEPRIVRHQSGIFSPYSMRCFTSTKETDIEHVVARSEAHESGLSLQPSAVRRAFATDIDNLTLAAPRLNRHLKSNKDPAEWLPVNNRCWYVSTYVEIKKKYGLTMDTAEAEAVLEVLESCSSFAMILPACN